MVKIMIDMTSRPHKRYRSGDLFQHGKMFDVSTDKDAIQIKNGSYKCGVCVREDLRRQLNY